MLLAAPGYTFCKTTPGLRSCQRTPLGLGRALDYLHMGTGSPSPPAAHWSRTAVGRVPVPCLLAQRWAHGAPWSKVLFFSAESVPGPDFQHYWTENPREVLGPEGSSGAMQLWIMSW